MKNDEQHLATLLSWRNRLTILRILAGPSADLDDVLRIADRKISELVAQHQVNSALDIWN
ncbi:hypothetical protein [Schleiferilactobacillus shenzhenensis]|uniref:Uncharacterized protein n=1 Tax=Schleiferilactobacillus shenzhenensis LY-73 TaxID=1231336 RepID=U4TGU7_9LACO|nr:hypothetical protein [Schleiferilactobacillus shenzhenensis]ERL64011.1 hypothetical protein L248_1658 [Schleiferilactobacillus shenzhenensis LY-73]